MDICLRLILENSESGGQKRFYTGMLDDMVGEVRETPNKDPQAVFNGPYAIMVESEIGSFEKLGKCQLWVELSILGGKCQFKVEKKVPETAW